MFYGAQIGILRPKLWRVKLFFSRPAAGLTYQDPVWHFIPGEPLIIKQDSQFGNLKLIRTPSYFPLESQATSALGSAKGKGKFIKIVR